MSQDLKEYISSRLADGPVYMPYLTVGDPSREATIRYAAAMIDAGADLMELGLPFSDPTADGPVIQAAMVRAMAQPGFNLSATFDTIESIHKLRPKTPLVILSYANPVLRGLRTGPDQPIADSLDLFLGRAAQCGVRALVTPDLPFDSPEGGLLRKLGAGYGIDSILMAAPNSSDDRLRAICAASRGFIYYVTSLGVTGVRQALPPELQERVALVRRLSGLPVLAGFGFSSPEQAAELAGVLDGIIVGSLNHRIIAESAERAEAELARVTAAFKAASRRPALAAGEKEL
ncbi:MAG: tryptophan synthase subunit alpha [Leptospirales bacterium]|nr:tryptophan synthase subunit alpha [Leptospirales bacterium]